MPAILTPNITELYKELKLPILKPTLTKQYNNQARDNAIGICLSGLTPYHALLGSGLSVAVIKEYFNSYNEDADIKVILDELFSATQVYINKTISIINKIRCDKEYYITIGVDYNGELKRAKDLETRCEALEIKLKGEIERAVGADIVDDICITLIRHQPTLVGSA